jgi:hypothetical protein
MPGPYYAAMGGTRICDTDRVDQSGADDTGVTDWVIGTDFIVCVNINSGGKDTEAAQYKLRWRNVTDSGSYADLGAAGELTYNSSTVLVQGTDIAEGTRRCSSQGGDAWQAGEEVEGASLCDSIDLADEYETEIHFGVDCDNALAGKEYAFELYDTTNGASKGNTEGGATLTIASVVVVATRGIKPFRGIQINKAHPLSRGLVGGWVFNEGGGNKVFDLSGNGNSGTLSGPDWQSDEMGFALDFNGSSDYVSLPNELVANINTYTVAFWFKSTETGTGNIIYSETDVSDGNPRMFLTLEGNSGFEFSHRDDATSEASITTATTYNDDEWHFAVGLRKAANDWELIIDDVSKGTDSTSVAATTVERYEIGARRSTTDLYFGGQINGGFIYNRVLTTDEIRWIYSEPYAMFERPRRATYFYVEVTGRTTKNTDAWYHGQKHGESFRIS